MSLLEQFSATVVEALGPVASVANAKTADATDISYSKQCSSVSSVGSVSKTLGENKNHTLSSLTRIYMFRLTDRPDAWLTMLAPGCELDQARRDLVLRFGADRVIEVRERAT